MTEQIMRAKLQVGMVQENFGSIFNNDTGAYARGDKIGETLTMHAVCKNKYDETGLDEDNTFAKYSPGAALSIQIANPALWGKFTHGDKFYVDFTPAQK